MAVYDTCDNDLRRRLVRDIGGTRSHLTVGSAIPYAIFESNGESDPSAGEETLSPA